MDMSKILAAVGRMFPSADLQKAAREAEEAISGTADTLEGVQAAANRLGLNAGVADAIYTRYGRTMQARAICGLLGTTPEALKADADKILGPSPKSHSGAKNGTQTHQTNFPRLK